MLNSLPSAEVLKAVDETRDKGLVAGSQGADTDSVDISINGLLGGFLGGLERQKKQK